jgi:pSer/pThr/pTyr-binding forkhead associated (FHA) protein
MSEVIVTLRYAQNQIIDLALPEDVPSQFLARTLAENVLRLPVPANQMMVLSVERPGGRQKLSPASTLADAGVFNGAFLNLGAEAAPAGLGAYLLASSGVKFLLRPANQIGRQGSQTRVHLEVDLTPLDEKRVISRQHARIELRDNTYLLEDLASRNGTFVNARLLERGEKVALKSGDRLSFGPEDKGGVELLFVWHT